MPDKRQTLITTSINGLKNDVNNIFLGNWCAKEEYILRNKNVVRYHWDDRKKLKKDYIYLNNLYEKLLEATKAKLNHYHQVNYSKNYWRIHAGYWLYSFVCSLFEKWENIDQAFKENPDINFTKVINRNDYFSYQNTSEFLNFSSTDEWNHHIYFEILNYLKKIKKINIDFEFIDKDIKIYKGFKKNLSYKLKLGTIKLYNFLFGKIIKKQKVFIYRTYTGKYFEVLLNFSFGQLPCYINKFNQSAKLSPNERGNNFLSFKKENEFEKFVNSIFFEHIPKCFFEDFKEIGKFISKNSIPQSPKVIFSTTALYSDDIFTRVCAEQKEIRGNSLIYCQHGGVYGQIEYTWVEEHEQKVSDSYLTWGWKNDQFVNTRAFGIIKKINNLKFKIPKKLINVAYFLRSRPKYPARIDGSIGANTMCKYFENCLEFFKNPLAKQFENNIYLRLHERNFQWDHEKIWKRELPNIKLTRSNEETLSKVYMETDLIIYSYIATGFLESLALDKPNILISKLDEWPLKKNVINDFKKLSEAGIFFETNEDALLHLNKYKDNLDVWWNVPNVVKIKKEFVLKFANLIPESKKISFLKKIIKEKLN